MIDDFVKRVEENWPVAYAEYDMGKKEVIEPLFDHLLLTASLSVSLFKDRITVVEKKTGLINLVEAMYTASLLHDIGKSSIYFLNKFKSSVSAKVSFMYHELVGALLLESAVMSSNDMDETTIKLIRIIARAIARHHAAMEDRHPAKFDHVDIENLKNILNGINIDVIDSLYKISQCESKEYYLCNRAIKGLKEVLEKRKFDIKASLNQIKRLGDEREEASAVLVISGFLVVADNIAAHAARGTSDDRISPAYIMEWISELREKLEKSQIDKVKRLIAK